ncbi:hypothetical protein HMPREF1601_02147 [Escherichia coli 907779]|nr:hypothetical protein HMPREF1601_02147 [Escherichia coli 907779]
MATYGGQFTLTDKLQEPTAEMMKKAREYRDQEEARRLEHRVQILPPS